VKMGVSDSENGS